MPQILVDENVPISVMEWLKKRGLNVITLTVIVIRAKPPTPSNIIEALNKTLKKIELDELQKKLAVITKRKIRIIT